MRLSLCYCPASCEWVGACPEPLCCAALHCTAIPYPVLIFHLTVAPQESSYESEEEEIVLTAEQAVERELDEKNIIIEVLVPGDGVNFPMIGDIVRIRYVVYLVSTNKVRRGALRGEAAQWEPVLYYFYYVCLMFYWNANLHRLCVCVSVCLSVDPHVVQERHAAWLR